MKNVCMPLVQSNGKMVTIYCWFLFAIFVYARCDNEIFKKTHPLYGMATLSRHLGLNESLCYQQLDLFALAMNEEKFWAIKGNCFKYYFKNLCFCNTFCYIYLLCFTYYRSRETICHYAVFGFHFLFIF